MECSNEREKLHSKIIRDADKIDILYILTTANKKSIWEKEDLSQEKMSDEIFREFMEERKTAVDLLVSHFAFVFDFNDKSSLQIVKEKEDFEKLYQRFQFENQETKERMEKIYKMVHSYEL